MTPNQQKILDIMMADPPPATVQQLAAAANMGTAYVYSLVTLLIKNNDLPSSRCPWRNETRRALNKASRRSSNDNTADLESKLLSIIDANGSDRVSAIRELREIRTAGGSTSGVPTPSDRIAMVESLSRIIQSAGRDMTNEAMLKAWPPKDTNATEAPAPDMDGPPPSGSDLD